MKKERGNHGARVAITVIVLAFASSLSIRADDQTAASPSFALAVVTLTQCVEQALSAGPGVRLSNANLASAKAQYTVSAAANSLGLGGSVAVNHSGAPYDTRYYAPGTLITGQDTARAGLSLTAPLSTSVGLSAGHTIDELTPPGQLTDLSLSASSTIWDGYLGGKALAAVKQASLVLQGTQTSEDANQKGIVYSVKQAYYTLLGAQQQLSILEQTLTQRQQELQKTQALLDAEQANQIDLKQARVNLTQASLDLKKAQDAVEIDRETLSGLVGWTLDKSYAVAEVEDQPAPSLDVQAAIQTALSRRADLKQLTLSLASGEIDLALKRGQSTPTVSANGSLTYSHDWVYSRDNATFSFGVSLSAPIIDAGSNTAQVAQAQLANDKLRVQQEQLAASIATAVKSAVYSLRDLLARVELARANLDLQNSQYDLTKLQFDSGVSSNLDVLAASVARTTAEVNLAAARNAAQLGVLALQSAMGL